MLDSRLTRVARAKESGEAARDHGDDEDRPQLQADIDNPAGRRQRVPDLRRHGQQLHGGEEGCITESVDIPAFLPTLKCPCEHGAGGVDHNCDSERKQQAREESLVPFLNREEPRQFFSYHCLLPPCQFMADNAHHVCGQSAHRFCSPGVEEISGKEAPRVPNSEMRWYTDEQLARLFQATEGDRFHALWLILGTLGLRLGEALGLMWADIDMSRGTVAVRRALQRDRKNRGLVLSELKTKRSRRTLTLGPSVAAALQAHRDKQDFERRKAGDAWQESGLNFTSIYGGALDQTRIHEHWKPACAVAGLPRYRVHDLRHSAASSLIANGMGLLEVAHFLGHANASMVVRVYGHVAPGDHKETAAMMEALLERHRSAV